MPFVLLDIDCALVRAIPCICNSDQGSHFTSSQYLKRLQTSGVQISMDGKGRALDNIFTERLWRTVKYEEVYLHEYDSPRAIRPLPSANGCTSIPRRILFDGGQNGGWGHGAQPASATPNEAAEWRALTKKR